MRFNLRTFQIPFLRPVLVLVILCAGCAAPARTFVSERDAKKLKRSAITKSEPASRKPPASISPPTEAKAPEPSVWSKWVGALVPTKPKPTQRIPLPRTDPEVKESGQTDSAEFSGFYSR